MAVQAGYGGAASLTTPKPPPRKGVGSGLAGAIGGFTPSQMTPILPSLPGAIGAGSGGGGPVTTTTTVTPLQVYQDEILGDPGSVAALGTYTKTEEGLANARASAIRQAVLNSGWTPDLANTQAAGYASDLRPTDISNAQNNPFSQKAQLDLSLAQAQANTPYDLAATGMGRSGAAAIQQGNLSRQYDLASYQGMQDLLNAIFGAGNTYASGVNEAGNTLNAARLAIEQMLSNRAGYSQSITTDGGDGGDGGDLGANWTIPGLDVPPAPAQATYYGSPGYMAAPSTQAAVQRVIDAIKKPPPNLNQIIRNVRAG